MFYLFQKKKKKKKKKKVSGGNKGISDSGYKFHDRKVLWASNNDKKQTVIFKSASFSSSGRRLDCAFYYNHNLND